MADMESSVRLDQLLARIDKAQQEYASFSQEQVDTIFKTASLAANHARIPLAKMAQEETGMGIVEDKVIKNHFAAEFIYNKYKNTPTCGKIEEDTAAGIQKIAVPMGIICCIIPTTNPTSTAIFKTLLALKTRNGVIISPHPRAKKSTVAVAKIVLEAAVKAGAPKDIIGWIEEPSMAITQAVMTHPKVAGILATGGPSMVKSAYSSGKPAIGVGAGNTPALIDETADIVMAVNSVILSKTFDNGVICASEQSVIVHKSVAEAVKKEFTNRGSHFLNKIQIEKIRNIILDPVKKTLNSEIVGKSAYKIAEIAGFKVSEGTNILIGEVSSTGVEEPFAHEKLSPVLAFYTCKDFEGGIEKARLLIELEGLGHTAVVYTDPANQDRITRFGDVVKTARILVNMPSSQGAIGDIYNFRLEPSMTLGCGSWGGNSVSENVSVRHLLNIKTIAERRENMLWFKVPAKIYHNYGCLPTALRDLQGKKRAFIVTDPYLFDHGYANKITDVLTPMGFESTIFSQVQADPTLETVADGVKQLNNFQPDVIIALGGGSPMDAAKIMWLMYEHPEVNFQDLAVRFMDIMKRVYDFPKLGIRADFVAIPTTSGTGSEVTPFSVITDEKTGNKYPLADYAITPTMAILDSELVMDMPKNLTAASGIDAITHGVEAIASVMSTDYTNALAYESLRLLFKYLPESYNTGSKQSREKVHDAASMAGMAFANAFLGVCHSMAHKLGAAFHIPHGVANALLIGQVIRYNSSEMPTKQCSFPQYEYPQARSRYARIADYLGLKGGDNAAKTEALIAAIDDLKQKLGIPMSIKDAGVLEHDFLTAVDQLAEDAFDDQCTGSNPRYPLISEIKQLYLNAFYGDDKAV